MCVPPSGHPAETRVREWPDEPERDQGGSSWKHASSEPLRPFETRQSREQRPYDIPLLTRAFEWPSPDRDERPSRFLPRISPGVEPPPTPGIDSPNEPSSVRSHPGKRAERMMSGRPDLETEDDDFRLLRPPHYPDTQYGRHHSAPLYGSDDWERRVSFGRLPPPGAQPEGGSSRVVLPPVRDLLGELGMLPPEQYERGPVLPQLRLPEEPGVEHGLPEEGERRRGKGRTETREEGEEKRAVVRKIYVACDFCRGRKLRCDGGRPRCFNCETRSLMCKYQEHPRRRGPGKAPKGTRTRKPRKKGGGEDPDMAGPSVVL